MVGRDGPFRNRRRFLQMVGVSAAGGMAVKTTGTVSASDPEASVTVEEQETKGGSLVVSAHTEIEGSLVFRSAERVNGEYLHFHFEQLEAGAEFTDREIDLGRFMFESREMDVLISPDEPGFIAGDTAFVTVTDEYPYQTTFDDPQLSYINPTGETDFHHPYVLYRPSDPVEYERPIFVEPTPYLSTDIEKLANRAEEALSRNGSMRRKADNIQAPALMALFPNPNFIGYYPMHIGYDALTRDEPLYTRYDQQLMAMVDDAAERLESREDESHSVADKIHLHGSSSGATFVSRISILQPERVNAFTAGATGLYTLPKEEVDEDFPAVGDPDEGPLPYPWGVGDLEELIGEEFNKDAWKSVGKFLMVGDEDQPEPGTSGHRGFPDDKEERLKEIFGINRVKERFPVVEEVYQSVDPDARFRIYEGYGHTSSPANDDFDAFHKEQMENEYETVETENDETVETENEDGESVPSTQADDEFVEDQPGFGVVQAAGSLGGAGYLLKRHLSDTDQ